MITSDRLTHINEIWLVAVQYIELAQVPMHEFSFVVKDIDILHDGCIDPCRVIDISIFELWVRDLILS